MSGYQSVVSGFHVTVIADILQMPVTVYDDEPTDKLYGKVEREFSFVEGLKLDWRTEILGSHVTPRTSVVLVRFVGNLYGLLIALAAPEQRGVHLAFLNGTRLSRDEDGQPVVNLEDIGYEADWYKDIQGAVMALYSKSDNGGDWKRHDHPRPAFAEAVAAALPMPEGQLPSEAARL